MRSGRVKVVAIYFPQLHAIPENDAWWGEGFTDWVNVRRAAPLYAGHNQPRVPLDGIYYDQSDPAVIRRQVAMAKEHGISAFCHYHYWFDGKQLLERPTNSFLEMKDLDIEFCLSWANETWSRRWDGQDHQILQLQTHPPSRASWGRHFSYLVKAWSDPRALRVDGKPLFMIYRPDKVEGLGDMLEYWRERAREHGIGDLYFMGVVQYKTPAWQTLRHLDALFLFQPFVAHQSLLEDVAPPAWRRLVTSIARPVPAPAKAWLQAQLDRLKGPTRVDYDAVWRRIVEHRPDRAIPTFEGAFVDWDNTARYGRRAKIFEGGNPERFEHWMRLLIQKVSGRPPEQRLIFVNAWNEWAEGAHLEPDVKSGFGYLEAIRRVTEERGLSLVDSARSASD